jgi:hypothetical protein
MHVYYAALALGADDSHVCHNLWLFLSELSSCHLIVGLGMRLKLFVHSSGFYPSAFLSIEILSDKTDDPCNSTQAFP